MTKKSSVMTTLGSTAHGLTEREKDDFYMTQPIAATCLAGELEKLGLPLPNVIWECACGNGKLSAEFWQLGHTVVSTDLVDRDYGISGVDFLSLTEPPSSNLTDFAIVTNPPFKHAEAFVRKGLDLVPQGGIVAMFLRTLFLESVSRKKLFEEHPPRYVMVASRRINCWKPTASEDSSSAMSFSWFVWEKGYKGPTQLVWFDKSEYE